MCGTASLLVKYKDLVGIWKAAVVAEMPFARCFLPGGYGEQDSRLPSEQDVCTGSP